jgi:hypothetical protein
MRSEVVIVVVMGVALCATIVWTEWLRDFMADRHKRR